MEQRPFAFVPFGSTARESAIACDGLVDGAGLHASHWAGNRTPVELKADTSTEIALRLVERGVPKGAEIANNHFDADGVLAVFALLEPDVAMRHAVLITAASEAGDFDEWPTHEGDRGLKLEMAIRSLASGAWPSATAPRTLAGGDERSYAETLPRLPALLDHLDDHRALWEKDWLALFDAERRAKDELRVHQHEQIAVLVHRPGTAELPGPVLSKRAPTGVTRWLLAFDRGDGTFDYRYERPRWAWADTVRRPRLPAPSRHAVVRGLGDAWALKGDLGMTGITRTTKPVSLDPGEVASALARNDAGAVTSHR